jgi:hypothetical protein
LFPLSASTPKLDAAQVPRSVYEQIKYLNLVLRITRSEASRGCEFDDDENKKQVDRCRRFAIDQTLY